MWWVVYQLLVGVNTLYFAFQLKSFNNDNNNIDTYSLWPSILLYQEVIAHWNYGRQMEWYTDYYVAIVGCTQTQPCNYVFNLWRSLFSLVSPYLGYFVYAYVCINIPIHLSTSHHHMWQVTNCTQIYMGCDFIQEETKLMRDYLKGHANLFWLFSFWISFFRLQFPKKFKKFG